MTFDNPQRRYRSQLGGHVIDHAMVRWDATNRDRPGRRPTSTIAASRAGRS
jgi:hypothetical protein